MERDRVFHGRHYWSPHVLRFAEFRKLVDETEDHSDIIKNAQKYTSELGELHTMFDRHPGPIAKKNHHSRMQRVLLDYWIARTSNRDQKDQDNKEEEEKD